jgi:hypothetical protein
MRNKTSVADMDSAEARVHDRVDKWTRKVEQFCEKVEEKVEGKKRRPK